MARADAALPRRQFPSGIHRHLDGSWDFHSTSGARCFECRSGGSVVSQSGTRCGQPSSISVSESDGNSHGRCRDLYYARLSIDATRGECRNM